jgi:hypothetical protein
VTTELSGEVQPSLRISRTDSVQNTFGDSSLIFGIVSPFMVATLQFSTGNSVEASQKTLNCGRLRMSRTRLALVIAALTGLAATFAAPCAHADSTGVEYQISNLGGEWQYTYTLTGTALGVNQAFTVFFDPTLTSNLTDTSADFTNPSSAAAANWASFALQGDPVLLSEGFYTALSLTGADGSTDSFTVTFDYLGTGAPGSQAFSIDQFDANGNLISNLETGQTTPFVSTAPVPEPGSGLLLLLGTAVLLGLGLRGR